MASDQDIVLLDRVADQVSVHGIRLLYPNTGRYAFEEGVSVRRWCWLGREDGSIRPEYRGDCHALGGVDEVASAVGAHVGGLRLGSVWMVPHVHWEHELLDHCPQTWGRVLGLLGISVDDEGLTGGNAVSLEAEARLLGEVVGLLLAGLTQSSVLLLAAAPLIVRVHPHGQVWLNSPDGGLLPVDEEAV